VPSLSPPGAESHDAPLTDAELAALGLTEVKLDLSPREVRTLRRQASQYYGRDVRRVHVSRFDLRGTQQTLLVVHTSPRPSAHAILSSLAAVLEKVPTEGSA
jgi:hypothetical protein